MFSSKKITVYIGKDRIWAGSLRGLSPKSTIFKWSGSDLKPYFEKIAQKYKRTSFEVVAGESMSYVFVKDMQINGDNELSLNDFFGIVPDSVSSVNTRWKIINVDKKNGIQWTEFFILSSDLVTNLNIVDRQQLHIDSVFPISKLIAHKYRNEKAPTLVIWKGYETIAVVCFKGVVYMTSSTVETKPGEISQIIKQSKEEFNVKLKNVYSNSKELLSSVTFPKSWKIKIDNIDPFSEMEKVKDNESNMFLKLNQDIKVEVSLDPNDLAQIQEEEEREFSKKNIFLIFVSVATIISAIAFAIFYWKSTSKPKNSLENNIEIVKPTTKPAEDTTPASSSADLKASVDLSDYLVQVQNGSGTAGVAGDIASQLEQAGFVGVDTGNADGFDYAGITVNYKTEIPESVISKIKDLFKEDKLTVSDSLDKTSEYDIILVVGSR